LRGNGAAIKGETPLGERDGTFEKRLRRRDRPAFAAAQRGAAWHSRCIALSNFREFRIATQLIDVPMGLPSA
jgi:hypothetical protein